MGSEEEGLAEKKILLKYATKLFQQLFREDIYWKKNNFKALLRDKVLNKDMFSTGNSRLSL